MKAQRSAARLHRAAKTKGWSCQSILDVTIRELNPTAHTSLEEGLLPLLLVWSILTAALHLTGLCLQLEKLIKRVPSLSSAIAKCFGTRTPAWDHRMVRPHIASLHIASPLCLLSPLRAAPWMTVWLLHAPALGLGRNQRVVGLCYLQRGSIPPREAVRGDKGAAGARGGSRQMVHTVPCSQVRRCSLCHGDKSLQTYPGVMRGWDLPSVLSNAPDEPGLHHSHQNP